MPAPRRATGKSFIQGLLIRLKTERAKERTGLTEWSMSWAIEGPVVEAAEP